MDYLSLCLIAKDEDEYLQEWLDYHILVGIEQFYIYDNESKKPIRDLLKEYIDAGWVVVHEIEGTAVQVMAYNHCLQTYGKYSKWIGFIDADEFIVLTQEKDLKQFLQKYEAYGGLAISSVFFGTGGHVGHPAGGQIINYQERFFFGFDDNQLIKSIVQPSKVEFPNSPHDFTYKDPYYCVNTNKNRVDAQRFPICHEEIRLNHYFTRSELDFKQKINRVGGDGRQIKKEKLKYLQKLTKESDDTIFHFLTFHTDLALERVNSFSQNNDLFCQFLHSEIKSFQSKKIKPLLFPSDINSDDFIPHCFLETNLVNHYKANLDWKNAKRILLNCIKNYPHMLINYTGYASTCIIEGDLEEARKALEIALSKFGKTYEIMRVIGDYWVSMKNYEKAEECFIRMLKIGEELDTVIRLTYVQIMQKKYTEAVKYGIQVVEKYLYSIYLDNEFFKKVLVDCIRILNHQGRKEKAIIMAEGLKHRFPDENLIITD